MVIPRAASPHPRPFVRGRVELPKVVEFGEISVGLIAIAPKEPEIAAAIGPCHSIRAASGHIPGSSHSQRAVHSGAARAASAHPCPLVRGRVELPKVVETVESITGYSARAPKEPEIAVAVGPCRSGYAGSWDVSSGGRSQRAVHAGLVTSAASSHPRPFVRGRAEHPQLVARTPKEPEIAVAVGPTRSAIAASRDVSGSGRSQRAVDAGLVTSAASAHPGPFVRGRIELPKVVEFGEISVGLIAIAPKEPEIAVAVGPGRSVSAASGDVSSSGRSQCSIYSGPAFVGAGYRAASAHPGPVAGRRLSRRDCGE
jgi:hypothetical protein